MDELYPAVVEAFDKRVDGQFAQRGTEHLDADDAVVAVLRHGARVATLELAHVRAMQLQPVRLDHHCSGAKLARVVV